MSEESTDLQKSNSGRFQKGQSGNPAGRPKGSKNKMTLIKEAIEADLVDQAQGDAMAVYKKTVDLAKAGDTTCIKILMDRLWPAGRRDEKEKAEKGGVNIIIKGLEVEAPKPIEGEVIEDA